jgi:hypothetical protein
MYEVRKHPNTPDEPEKYPWTAFEKTLGIPVRVSDSVPPGVVQLWDNNRLVDEIPVKE